MGNRVTMPMIQAFNVCRLKRYLAQIMLGLALTAMPVAAAYPGDMTHVPVSIPKGAALLDGKVFAGGFGVLGKKALVQDNWIFRNGTFMSMQCEKCGYPRGRYTTQRKNGMTMFKVETPCPKTDATIVWHGAVKGDRIEGIAIWTRRRWYRTVRKKFWFKGTLRPTESATHQK